MTHRAEGQRSQNKNSLPPYYVATTSEGSCLQAWCVHTSFCPGPQHLLGCNIHLAPAWNSVFCSSQGHRSVVFCRLWAIFLFMNILNFSLAHPSAFLQVAQTLTINRSTLPTHQGLGSPEYHDLHFCRNKPGWVPRLPTKPAPASSILWMEFPQQVLEMLDRCQEAGAAVGGAWCSGKGKLPDCTFLPIGFLPRSQGMRAVAGAMGFA